MIVIGLICAVVGAIFGIRPLVLLGVAAVAIGLILAVSGNAAY